MINIKPLSQNRQVFIKFERMSDDILYEIDNGLHDIGKLLYDDLRKGLRRGQRGGLVFKYGNQILRHSRAGEYPQKVTGTLRDSVGFNIINQKLNFGIENPSPKGKSTEYANYLEEGTFKMKKRLLVGYTAEKTKKQQINIFEKRINSGVKKY